MSEAYSIPRSKVRPVDLIIYYKECGLLDGKIAIVTGSSRGIGRAIAERLGANGASVIVNYRSDGDAAEQVVARIEEGGGRAVAVRADVTDADELRGLFDAAERHYGGLDIVVSNVGVARFVPLAEFTGTTSWYSARTLAPRSGHCARRPSGCATMAGSS
jgi:NAD(P)-dependent dehydrogenase (short-subunit alcohol dehydrogenase family)